MKVLVAGWFSFSGMGATAGDLIARDVVCSWLAEAGCAYDVAAVTPFTPGVDWRQVDPASYSHVVFVCGPFGDGEPITSFLERFADTKLVGVDLSMLQSLDEWDPFDLLIERDSSRRSHPDLVFAAELRKVPVVGLTTIHAQPEYGSRDLHLQANDALRRLVGRREAAVVPIDTRLDEPNLAGLRTPAEITSLFGVMDLVATTRLHGMVLALANGVPAVVIDSVRGGAKVTRQAVTIGWPLVFRAENLREAELHTAFDSCLSQEYQQLALTCRENARAVLLDACREFQAFFKCSP